MDDWYAAAFPSTAQFTTPKLQEKAETIENKNPNAVMHEPKAKYDLDCCAANLESNSSVVGLLVMASWAISIFSLTLELVMAMVSG